MPYLLLPGKQPPFARRPSESLPLEHFGPSAIDQLMELLQAAAEEVSTSSTKQRVQIFREKLPPLLQISG